MKKVSKISGFFMLVLSLLVSMNVIAFAATSKTTGLKDGIYTATTTPNADKSSFKLNVTVDGGNVLISEFAWYNDTMKLTPTMVKFAPAETQAGMQATLDEIADYNAQMTSKLDGALVTKYAKAANNDLYTTFQNLWKDVVSQAGGQLIADTPATTTTTTDSTTTTSNNNPETGDNGVLGYVVLAGAALAAMIVLGRKKVTS